MPEITDSLIQILQDKNRFNALDYDKQFDTLKAACEKFSDPTIQKILMEGEFDLDIRNNSGYTILCNMVENHNTDVVRFLAEKKLVDLNIPNKEEYPLSIAKNLKLDEIADILSNHGARIKIKESEFQNLLEEAQLRGDRAIKISELLEQKGFLPNLDDCSISSKSLKKTNFDRVDFSGVSFERGQILFHPGEITELPGEITELKFQGCNLQDANLRVMGSLASEGCFDGANIDGCKLVTTPQAIQKVQSKNAAKIVFVDPNRNFNQGLFRRELNKTSPVHLNESGVCRGLCVEYARYFVKERDDDSHTNAINKFSIKGPENQNFIKRLNLYHAQLQRSAATMTAALDEMSVDAMFSKMGNPKVVAIDMFRIDKGHAMAIRAVEEGGKKMYRYFDPNYGESPPLTSEEVSSQMRSLYQIYNFSGDIQFHDLSKMVQDLDLTNKQDKGAKYLESSLTIALQNNDIEAIKKLAADNKYKNVSPDFLQYQLIPNAKTPEAIIAFVDLNDIQASQAMVDIACLCNISMVPGLINAGAAPTSKALWEMACHDKVTPELLQKFTAAGVDLNYSDNGESILEVASKSNKKIVPDLVNAGAAPTSKALWEMARHGKVTPELLQKFIAAGVDLNYSDNGESILDKAAYSPNMSYKSGGGCLVADLIDAGAKPTAKALWAMILSDDTTPELLSKFVSANIDLNYENKNVSILDIASEVSDIEVVHDLLKAGASLTEKCLWNIAARGICTPELLRKSVELGFDINASRRDGKHILDLTYASNKSTVHELIEAGLTKYRDDCIVDDKDRKYLNRLIDAKVRKDVLKKQLDNTKLQLDDYKVTSYSGLDYSHTNNAALKKPHDMG